MQIKPAASVALLFMLLLMGQAFTGHLNQIPGEERATELDSPTVVMSSNNTTDTDGDGIYDTNDDCPNGETNWTSSYSTDHDGDGCKDNSSEDMDDDNDGLVDAYDSCMVGNLGWISSNTTDYDSDGCQDSSEDLDDDNDGVLDANDSCMTGDLGWISSNTTDADSDGCRDATEDTDGGAGSGNSSTGCGNDASYTSLYAYSYSSYYYVNDTFTGVMSVYCGLVNMTMTLDYSILNASNSTVDSGNMSWIGSNSNYTNEIWNTTLTQSGTYGFYTVLGYYDANQTWTQLDTDYDTFTVWNQTNGGGNNGGNNTGGNNTGGNNTGGCGDDASYTSLYAYSSSSYYYVNDTFTGIMNINCGLVNMTMTLDYSILDASNSTVDSGNMSWVPSTSIYTYEFWNTTLTQAGTYGFYAVLGYYDANQTWTQLDTGYDTFSVLNQTNGGGNNGGNNTGGNNTTQLTYNAYLPQYCFSTAEDIEIFMTISGLNATEFYLEWEISSGSAMVASGSPLININSSGIVSYDWTFNTSVLSAGVYTIMLNPADSGLSNLFSNSPFYYNIEVDCNNTGGNNTGGNNTGGNNTGGNATMNDSHCLIIDYVMMNASGNEISMNLTNICPFPINYPAANLTVDHPVVSGLYYQTTWFYMIPANGSYNVPWQLSFGQNITNGTIITFTFNAWILNCENNNSFHQCPDSVQSISTYSFVYLTSNTGGNNTGGNNTGGNNTGGNNTGGNNTGGNNTGGNNTGGNNTGGNNTGGNNTGGNNTGGNNTGGNNTTDTDGDGIIDALDNCPTTNNSDQSDLDQDGLGDVCDGDTDGDGLADADDAFPEDPMEQSDLDGDGVGDNTDADDDGDGVTDANDNCPLIANSDQADLDGNGVGTACDGLEVTIDDNGTIAVDGDSLPALGMVGTAVAISAGFLISIRREDEE